MNKNVSFLIGAGVGTGLMYFLDPQAGRRRRVQARDQWTHWQNQARDTFNMTSSDASNRAHGVKARLRNWVGTGAAADDVVCERVRSAIGRIVSHPGAIDVKAHEGRVTLSGPVLAHEIPRLLSCVESVRGVLRGVENRLEPHVVPGNVSALQGGADKPDRWINHNWSPTSRAGAGAASALAVIIGLARGGFGGVLLAIGGGLLGARAATNKPLSQMVGYRAGHAAEFEKAIHIQAPVERVFEEWSNAENFPQFMSHVQQVARIGGEGKNAHWRWTVSGPAGAPVHFESRTTAYQPNRVIGWQTEPGTIVPNAGLVRFHRSSDGGTDVNIRFSYNPALGAAGPIIASLLGADPKKQLDDDLHRMKSYIESRHPHLQAAAAVTQVH